MLARRAATLICLVAPLFLASPPAPSAMEMAVTVDDLPSHGPLPGGTSRLEIATQIIAALKRNSVKSAYGFLNGGQLQDAPDLEPIVRVWREAGLPLGNHTFLHADLSRVSAEEFTADIRRNEGVLARWDAANGRRYFRYPYLHEGDTADKRKAVRRWLAAHGYTIAPVSVDFEDWAWNHAYTRCLARHDKPAIGRMKSTFLEAAKVRLTVAKEVSTRLFNRQVPHILLLHIGAFDALMLDDLFRTYRAAGVKMISLDTALRDPAYAVDPGFITSGHNTHLDRLAVSRGVEIPVTSSRPWEAVDRLCP